MNQQDDFSEVILEPFEMTRLHKRARKLFARLCHRKKSDWMVIWVPEPGVWYDWACPITGTYGQCLRDEGGHWKQAPLGHSPVVLKYVGD